MGSTDKSIFYLVVGAIVTAVIIGGGYAAVNYFGEDEGDTSVENQVSDVREEEDTTEVTETESDTGETTEESNDTSNDSVEATEYISRTLNCKLHGDAEVVVTTEFPETVTVSEVSESDTECIFAYSYKDSVMKVGSGIGVIYVTDIPSGYVSIDSEYTDDLIRVEKDGNILYGTYQGENSQPEDNPYYGDLPHLMDRGLPTDSKIIEVDIAEQDDQDEVIEIFDYIAGHTKVELKS